MKVLYKLSFRIILKSFLIYLSLIILVILGVSSFLGISCTDYNMQEEIIKFSNDTNLADVVVYNNFTTSKEDIDIIKGVENVQEVEEAYNIFARAHRNDNLSESLGHSVYSISNTISTLKLLKGRLPVSDDEIVISNINCKDYNIGDRIKFYNDIDNNNFHRLLNKEYTVVGFVNSAEQIQRFPLKSLNNQNTYVDVVSYVKETNFLSTEYDLIRICINKSNITNSYNNAEYNLRVKKVINKIEEEITKKNLAQTKKQYIIKKLTPNNIQHSGSNLTNNISPLQNLEDLIQVKYYVKNRGFFSGYKEYIENARRLKILSYIFSGFLLSIALLVTSITISRILQDDRKQIGILKSLGYKWYEIIISYLMYSLTAALIGIILGSIFGIKVLSSIVYASSYREMFIFENLPTNFNIMETNILFIYIILTISLLPLVLNFIPIYKEKITDLMKPKNFKSKSMIFEKCTFLWNKISFKYKIVFRNIFTFKVRSLMLVLSVIGSLSLILTGIGIRDSLITTLDRQTNKIYKCDVLVKYNEKSDYKELEKLKNYIDNNDTIDKKLEIVSEIITIKTKEHETKEIPLIAFEDNDQINPFIGIYKNNKLIDNLPEDGIILSKKLSRLCSLKEGESIEANINDINDRILKVSLINDWYIFHQILVTNTYYINKINSEFNKNAYLIKFKPDISDEQKNNFIETISNSKANLYNIEFKKDIQDQQQTIDGLNLVISIMIIFALLLALIIFLNLINITILERTREIATLKVLGLYDDEVSFYIFREFSILTIIGIIIGIIIGYILENFIIVEITPKDMYFFQGILISNYFISTSITLLLLIIVYFLIKHNIKKIDMLESLKVIE